MGIEELFDPRWTQGSLEVLGPITNVLGTIACFILSLGGFFMVILPITRYVINGIVCVAPGLCDRIAEAHDSQLGFKQAKANNQVIAAAGSLLTLILSFVPNFKVISDFNEGIQDPKTLMMKGLPMMCIYVFIGVFIYQGYHAVIAKKASQVATSVIDMALNNVDPDVWVDKLTNKLARPNFSTDDAQDTFSKNVNALSKEIWTTVNSKYSDTTSENKQSYAPQIEQLANNILAQIMEHSDSTNFELSCDVRIYDFMPQTNANAAFPAYDHDTDNDIYIYQYVTTVSETMDIGTVGGTDGDYLYIGLRFREVPETAGDASNIQNVATLASNDFKSGDGNTCTWTAPSDGFVVSSTVKINGISSTNITTKTQNGTQYYVIEFPCSLDELKGSGDVSVVGLKARAGATGAHTITAVNFGSTYTFTPVDNRWTSWTIGTKPELASNVSSGEDEDSTENSGAIADN